VSWPRLKPDTSQIQIRSITASARLQLTGYKKKNERIQYPKQIIHWKKMDGNTNNTALK
jgi:hypothetical protein